MSSANQEDVDIELCIICQRDDKGSVNQLTSQPAGRANLKRAAEIREDIVTKRLCTIGALNTGDAAAGVDIQKCSSKRSI